MLETTSFAHSIDRFSKLKAEALRNDAVIKMQEKHADLYDRTITELEAERTTKMEKLESLDRLLASTQQQANGLKEDISTAEQFASCFKMRSMVNNHDDEPELGEDAERRKKRAQERIEDARRVLPRLRALTESRDRRRILEELQAPQDGHIARYVKSAARVVALCTQCVEARSQGTDDDAALHKQQLDRVLQHHFDEDEKGERLAGLAAQRLAELQADAGGDESASEGHGPSLEDGRGAPSREAAVEASRGDEGAEEGFVVVDSVEEGFSLVDGDRVKAVITALAKGDGAERAHEELDGVDD